MITVIGRIDSMSGTVQGYIYGIFSDVAKYSFMSVGGDIFKDDSSVDGLLEDLTNSFSAYGVLITYVKPSDDSTLISEGQQAYEKMLLRRGVSHPIDWMD